LTFESIMISCEKIQHNALTDWMFIFGCELKRNSDI
jgi:hypothetical protein